jgi:transcriptional regulator with XRE-family HTH domain
VPSTSPANFKLNPDAALRAAAAVSPEQLREMFDRNFSQTKIAIASGLSSAQVSKFLSGSLIFSKKHRKKLAKGFAAWHSAALAVIAGLEKLSEVEVAK